MEFHNSNIFAKFLNGILNRDEFAVDFMTEFSELFGDLNSTNRTKDSTGSTCFGSDCQSNAFESGSGSLGISLNLGDFVSTLLKVFCKHFESRRRCNYGFTLWDKVVTTISAFHFNNIVFVAEVANVFFQYKFHNKCLLSV